jgi:hypothetical protein
MATFQDFKDKALVGLFTFIVGMMWYDIKEMKQDIKTLVVSNTENKTRLDALERQVFKATAYRGPVPFDYPPKEAKIQQVAIVNKEEDDYFDQEDI